MADQAGGGRRTPGTAEIGRQRWRVREAHKAFMAASVGPQREAAAAAQDRAYERLVDLEAGGAQR